MVHNSHINANDQKINANSGSSDEAREQLSSTETTMEDRTTNDEEAMALERAVNNSRRAIVAAENWAAKAHPSRDQRG